MNFRLLPALLFLGCLVELCGCNSLLKKKDPDPAPVITPAVVATAAPTPEPTAAPVAPPPVAPDPAAAPVAVDENIVPAPQDFEDEATEKVTPANFRAQFLLLQADIK